MFERKTRCAAIHVSNVAKAMMGFHLNYFLFTKCKTQFDWCLKEMMEAILSANYEDLFPIFSGTRSLSEEAKYPAPPRPNLTNLAV